MTQNLHQHQNNKNIVLDYFMPVKKVEAAVGILGNTNTPHISEMLCRNKLSISKLSFYSNYNGIFNTKARLKLIPAPVEDSEEAHQKRTPVQYKV